MLANILLGRTISFYAGNQFVVIHNIYLHVKCEFIVLLSHVPHRARVKRHADMGGTVRTKHEADGRKCGAGYAAAYPFGRRTRP